MEEDLKAQAYLQRIGELTTEYEAKIAGIRVDYTNLANEYEHVLGEKQALQTQAEMLAEQLAALQNGTSNVSGQDIIAGEVVESSTDPA